MICELEHTSKVDPFLTNLARGITDSPVKTAETLDMLEKGHLKIRTDFSFEEKTLGTIERLVGYAIRAVGFIGFFVSLFFAQRLYREMKHNK